MLISRERGLLFIHIQKTGGSTVAQILRGRIPDMRWMGGTHEHAVSARAVLGDEFDSFHRFAFVRNPWDRLVSWYSMIRQKGPAQPPERLNRLWRYVLERSSTFEEFVLRCTDTIDDVDGPKSFLHNQLDYVSDPDGRLLVDWIGRYERFGADLRTLLDRVGLPDAEIPHVNPSRHRHYAAYYTPRTRDLVAERYERDVQAFGYAFEEEAGVKG